jgi:fructose-bisphosphate aldolase class II
MALVRMKELLEKARIDRSCVGAFNVGNMEMVCGLIRAAEERNTPVIMQIAEVRLDHSPLNYMGPMMIQAARDARVDVAVHLDHGKTMATIRQALDFGFTSVMYDGSSLPFDENVERTKEVVKLARKYDAAVEAELGNVGSAENGDEENGEYTDPGAAVKFTQMTGIDALAVAIGNAHGNYKKEPKLAFDVLSELEKEVSVPLVLHGGSGISDKDFRKAISMGIRKVNIATANFDSVAEYTKRYADSVEKATFAGVNEAMVAGMHANVIRHLQIFKQK